LAAYIQADYGASLTLDEIAEILRGDNISDNID
jgi:hypothetical protein